MDATFYSLFTWFQIAYIATFLCVGLLTFVWVLLHPSWHCANRRLVLWILLFGYAYAVICLLYLSLFQRNVIACNSTKVLMVLDVMTFVFTFASLDRITVVILGEPYGVFHRLKQSPARMIIAGLGVTVFALLSFLEHHLDSHDAFYSGSFYTIFCREKSVFSVFRHLVEYFLVYFPLVETFLQYVQQRIAWTSHKPNRNSHCLKPDMKLHGCGVTLGPCVCNHLRKPFTLLYQAYCTIVFLVRPAVMLVCLVSHSPYSDLLLAMPLFAATAYLCYEVILFTIRGPPLSKPVEVEQDDSQGKVSLLMEAEDIRELGPAGH